MKVVDPNNKRWEVPLVNKLGIPKFKPENTKYRLEWNTNPFGFSVSREEDGDVLFNSVSTQNIPQTFFSDQYLSIATSLPRNPNIYGLGERVDSLRLDPNNQSYTMWAEDNGTYTLFSAFTSL